MMIKIKLSFPSVKWPLEQQTPNHSGVWENCHFFINKPIKECDYWIVFEGPAKKREKTICAKKNTILITAVITCHRKIKHKNPVFQQQGLPWHIGRRQRNHVNLSFSKSYDDLVAIDHFHKDRKISVISSAKDFSAGHRQRIEFVKRLKELSPIRNAIMHCRGQ